MDTKTFTTNREFTGFPTEPGFGIQPAQVTRRSERSAERVADISRLDSKFRFTSAGDRSEGFQNYRTSKAVGNVRSHVR